MSTLKTGKVKTTTIADELDTESTAVTNVINGSAKAWVNFNGTGTVAIRASYNVTSITDNGTGNYTINFTNAFSDTNYAMLGTCEPSTVPGVGATFYTIIGYSNQNAFTKATTSMQVCTAYITATNGSSTAWDSQSTYLVFFR